MSSNNKAYGNKLYAAIYLKDGGVIRFVGSDPVIGLSNDHILVDGYTMMPVNKVTKIERSLDSHYVDQFIDISNGSNEIELYFF